MCTDPGQYYDFAIWWESSNVTTAAESLPSSSNSTDILSSIGSLTMDQSTILASKIGIVILTSGLLASAFTIFLIERSPNPSAHQSKFVLCLWDGALDFFVIIMFGLTISYAGVPSMFWCQAEGFVIHAIW